MADEMDWAAAANEIYEAAAFQAHAARRNALESQAPAVKGACVVCRDCDALIPRARLKANPGATRCIRCQEKHECKGA